MCGVHHPTVDIVLVAPASVACSTMRCSTRVAAGPQAPHDSMPNAEKWKPIRSAIARYLADFARSFTAAAAPTLS